MSELLDNFAEACRQGIEAPGQGTHFLILLFIASFGFIRTSADMIRSEMSRNGPHDRRVRSVTEPG